MLLGTNPVKSLQNAALNLFFCCARRRRWRHQQQRQGNAKKAVTTEWKLFRIFVKRKTFAVRVVVCTVRCVLHAHLERIKGNVRIQNHQHATSSPRVILYSIRSAMILVSNNCCIESHDEALTALPCNSASVHGGAKATATGLETGVASKAEIHWLFLSVSHSLASLAVNSKSLTSPRWYTWECCEQSRQTERVFGTKNDIWLQLAGKGITLFMPRKLYYHAIAMAVCVPHTHTNKQGHTHTLAHSCDDDDTHRNQCMRLHAWSNRFMVHFSCWYCNP